MKKKLLEEKEFQEPETKKKLKIDDDMIKSSNALISLNPLNQSGDELLRSDNLTNQSMIDDDLLKTSNPSIRIPNNNEENNNLITKSMNNIILNVMETTSSFVDSEIETSSNNLTNLSNSVDLQSSQNLDSQQLTLTQTFNNDHITSSSNNIIMPKNITGNIGIISHNNSSISNGNNTITPNNSNLLTNSNILSINNNTNKNHKNNGNSNQLLTSNISSSINSNNNNTNQTPIIGQQIIQKMQRENQVSQLTNQSTLGGPNLPQALHQNLQNLPPNLQQNLINNVINQHILMYQTNPNVSQNFLNYIQSYQLNNQIKEENKRKDLSLFNTKVKEKYESFKELEKKQEYFCKLKNNQSQQNYVSLRNMEVQQQKELEIILEQAKNLMISYIIEPLELFGIEEMKKTIKIQIHQMYVYQSELDFLMKKVMEQPKISMVVKNQPYPCVVKQKEKKKSKNKNDDNLTVVLLKGILSEIKTDEVTANVVFENFKQASANSIINGSAHLVDGVAKFNNLRFPKGTGVKMVRLNFKSQVTITMTVENQTFTNTQVIESTPTEPFIVMTNESQFGDSAMKLLKKSAFFKEEKTTWAYFANNLQLHYLSATRQTPNEIQRPLSLYDFDYIKTNFFKDKQEVDGDSFKELWKWFGKVLHKIRHQKPIPEMWNSGLIFSFVSKLQAQTILASYTPGHFILRFSEKSAGQLALAYVTNGGIKHYLIPPTVKKLPDFLREKESCKHFVVCKTEFNVSNLQELPKTVISKETAIGNWYTTSGTKSITGYEEYMN
eukprot:TRINITY_DN4553_c0_g1_i1.p1 TRINITY_DN4553_c0_g1~~TRINITY_DN4553_c0_g1_i1.p1  ORF type:complete len:780 (+),score=217.52 TRINITY_DN4553_c0_g1_i1:137-2476(+)